MSFQRMIDTASSPDANSCAIAFAVQPVALVLELAQLDQLALRILEPFELENRVAQLRRGALDHRGLLVRVVANLGDAVAEDVPRRLVDVVADVVERACEAVHVVAVERRDERAVEQVDDLVRQAVALVLGILDVARERVAVVREAFEQPHEQAARSATLFVRRAVVQVVELPPLRDEVMSRAIAAARVCTGSAGNVQRISRPEPARARDAPRPRRRPA